MSLGVLSETDGWYEQWCTPVVKALYAHDRQAAEAGLAGARQQLAVSRLSPDKRQALGLQLRYLSYQVEKSWAACEQKPALFQAVYQEISREIEGEASRALRARLLLILLAIGERLEYISCSLEQVTALLAEVPESDRDAELWHYIANWGFRHADSALLSEAVEHLVVQGPGLLSDYLFRRVHTMLQLVERRARRADIVILLNQIALGEQYRDFMRLLYPVCLNQGLIDEELDRALGAKAAALETQDLRSKLAGPA